MLADPVTKAAAVKFEILTKWLKERLENNENVNKDELTRLLTSMEIEINKKGLIKLFDKKHCTICNKEFYPQSMDWVYKYKIGRNNPWKWQCSYTCYCKANKNKKDGRRKMVKK